MITSERNVWPPFEGKLTTRHISGHCCTARTMSQRTSPPKTPTSLKFRFYPNPETKLAKRYEHTHTHTHVRSASFKTSPALSAAFFKEGMAKPRTFAKLQLPISHVCQKTIDQIAEREISLIGTQCSWKEHLNISKEGRRDKVTAKSRAPRYQR